MMFQKEEMLSLKKEAKLYFKGSSLLYRQSLDSSVRWNDDGVTGVWLAAICLCALCVLCG